ncbi:MAG: C40 family peptidase [Defluviitaleaceae bacterium]|nr:C40 family peptidase [Defluviitaleaceae bacterium]
MIINQMGNSGNIKGNNRQVKGFIKGFLAIFAVVLINILLATTAYAQAGQLTGNNVRVRTAPSLDSDILFHVSVGETVKILEEAGDFYMVNVAGSYNVFVAREFIAVIQAQYENDTDTYYYEETNDYNIAEYAVYILEEPYQVVYVDNNSAVYGNNAVAEILAFAKTLIGTPYRGGGSDTRGFDCSGFVTYVMRNFGVYLQRSSASMASSNGHYVERSNLVKGDLVFFATGSGPRISHVGIYVGNNQFIHSESGRGVRITGLSENYWNRRYVRANRVL